MQYLTVTHVEVYGKASDGLRATFEHEARRRSYLLPKACEGFNGLWVPLKLSLDLQKAARQALAEQQRVAEEAEQAKLKVASRSLRGSGLL